MRRWALTEGQGSARLNLSVAEVPCKTAPFASFSGRTEKEGPARPERVPISSSLVKAIKKGKCNREILRNVFDETISCDAGFADTTSFSLLDAKRTKQEKHAWGSIPHDPRARHFGSGQLRGTLKPVRRKGFKLTASRRFRQEAFSFPRCARKSPHEPRPSLAQRCLGLQRAILGAVNLQRSLLKCNLIFGTQKVAAQPVNLTTTQFSHPAFVSVIADGRPRQRSALLTAWLVREFLPIGQKRTFPCV